MNTRVSFIETLSTHSHQPIAAVPGTMIGQSIVSQHVYIYKILGDVSSSVSSTSRFGVPSPPSPLSLRLWVDWVSRYQNVSILDFIGAKRGGGGEW